jgi:hypothetical protein
MIRRFALPAAGLAVVALFAVTSTLHAEEETTEAGIKPVLTTFAVMDYLFDPPFEVLEDAMESEPEDRRGWRDIRRSSETLAELTNLLLIRDDLDYVDSTEWKEMTVAMREAAEGVVEASRTQDFPQAHSAFIALVQSCNACHSHFEPNTAPTFPIPGE